MTELRLYSPIRLYEKLPYEPPWTDTGEDVRTLSPAEARECRETVCEAMQHCLTPEEQKNGLATGMDGVMSAFPSAEADENGLTAVLVCQCSCPKKRCPKNGRCCRRNWMRCPTGGIGSADMAMVSV